MSGDSEFEPRNIENHAYKVLVNEVKDIAIYFLNPDGVISSWNIGAERMKGYSEKDVIGKHYSMLFTDEDRKNKRAETELRKAKETGRYEAEEIRRKKDGSTFRAHVTLTRQLDENRKLIGFFKVTRDVTERYYREKDAAIKSEEIERLSKLKDEFISIASHELKNPLTTVKAYMQLLKQNLAAETEIKKEFREYVTKSYSQISKLEKLIAEMLNASRIGAGKLHLNICEFDLSSTVAEIVEDMKRTHIKHTIEIKRGKKIIVNADRDRIEQVVVNYLTNAIRYSPPGSTIKVSVRSVDGNAQVSVKDQGIGISEKDRKNVFDRFFRSEGKGKKAGGLGLGLYIVKGIINQHGGQVSVESEIGKGSCFSFEIPLQPKNSDRQAAAGDHRTN